MAFTKTWNEATPAGSDNPRSGDDEIRDFKYAIRERLAIDHVFLETEAGANIGKHKWCQFVETDDIGEGTEGLPILGAQTIGGKAELVFTDEDDNDIQLTSGGAALAVAGASIQVVNTQTGAFSSGGVAIPGDNTIPQIGEGVEFMTRTITPSNAANKLKIEVVFNGSMSVTAGLVVALFRDAVGNALAVAKSETHEGSQETISFTYYMAAGGTSEITFRVRAGEGAGNTIYFNGPSGGAQYGGVFASSITVTEIKV